MGYSPSTMGGLVQTTLDDAVGGITRDHPVAALMVERIQAGSQPKARQDPHTLALVIEGGGMRGVVSGGMVTALQAMKLRSVFDLVVGTSAGALAGAYFIADQAPLGTSIYYEDLVHGDFVNYRRFLTRKGPLVSLEFLLDDVMIRRKPLDLELVLNSDVPLTVVTTSTVDYRPAAFSDFADADFLREALRASSRIPFASGDPVQLNGVGYVDGSVSQSIPWKTALDLGATHVLALRTRPEGQLRGQPHGWERRVLYPIMDRKVPGLGTAHLARPERYRKEIDWLNEHTQTPPSEGTQALSVVRPSDSARVRQLEQDPDLLFSGGCAGAAAVFEGLTGAVPSFYRKLGTF
jgi:predicted patatin/cPLA2 family phospholipase